MKTFNYRSGLGDGSIEAATLQGAFNAIAEQLAAGGSLAPNWPAHMRAEGHCKSGGKRSPAISQADLLVVAGPLPDDNKIYF